jgi:hypothetical protein
VNREALKTKLWAAIDALEDSEGFVLTAVSDEIVFTRLHTTVGYDSEALLELAPLNEPDSRKEMARLGRINHDLRSANTALEEKIETRKRMLAELDAAVEKTIERLIEKTT